MNNKKLVDTLIEEDVLRTTEIKNAFTEVDRLDFVRKENLSEAYGNYPLSIGYEQTISQPATVAFMLELLDPKAGEMILDIGSGSGWTTELLAQIVGQKGHVWGLEIIPELVQFGRENIAKYTYGNAEILQASENLGLANNAPFDKILVSAGNTKLPQELVEQLKEGGIMVIPIGDAIWKVVKHSGGKTDIEKFEGFAFVPLIH